MFRFNKLLILLVSVWKRTCEKLDMELSKGTKIEDDNWHIPNSERFVFFHLINQFVIVKFIMVI